MAKKATHTFIGLDTDTADHFVKEGRYRDALNVHIGSSEGAEMFSVENVKGNSLVSYSLPLGTNKVIGSHEDITNKVVYYFLYNEYTIPNLTTYNSGSVTIQNNDSQPSGIINSDLVRISFDTPNGDKWIVRFGGSGNVYTFVNPLRFIDFANDVGYTGTFLGVGTINRFKHAILKYDLVTNTISLVYQHSRLNFDPEYPITGSSLINGILSWTDGYNPPRSLKISDAGSYTNFFIEAELDFVRTPPSTPLTAVSSMDATLPNYMDDKSYQFIYRYVYKDDSRSVWSPLSELIPTGYLADKKNKISLTISNEETTNFSLYSQIIDGIELGFRDGDTFSFKFMDNIPFPTATTIATYIFYNDRGFPAIASDDTNHLFELVPRVAGAMAAIRNRIFFGDCLEGFNVTPSDFTCSQLSYTILTVPTKNVLGFKSSSIFDIGVVFFDRAQRKSGVYKLARASTERWTTDNSGMQRLIGANISFTVSGKPPIWATRFQIVRTKNLLKSFFLQGACIVINNTLSPVKESRVLFNGLNGKVVYVPREGDFLTLIKNVSNFANFPVKYKVLRTEGNYIVVEGTVPLTFSEGIRSYGIQYCEIYTETDPDTIYYDTTEAYPVISPYTESRRFGLDGLSSDSNKIINISKGDVSVRNLDDCYAYYSSVTLQFTTFSAENTSLPATITINGINITANAGSTANTATSMAKEFVEIINSKNYAFEAFFVGEVFNGLYAPHKFNEYNAAIFIIKSKTQGSGGSITFSSATTYVTSLTATSGTGAQTVINNSVFECMAPSDNLFEQWDKNIGRPNIILTDGDREVRRGSVVRHGLNYVTGTSINNLASFYLEGQKDIPGSGQIRKLIAASNNQAEGTVLLCVQDNEISSLYIGQTMIKNAGGGQNLAVTDDVIGTVNPLQKLTGTINPESVVQHNGNVYGFDALRGIVWRYGQDGLTLISEELGGGSLAGMRNFFYNRSQYLLSIGSFKCFAGIDPYSNEYVLSIPNTDAEKATIVWSETLNMWTSFMSFVGESYQKVNTGFISFKNGALWLHRSNSLYNNFYGTQYTSKIKMLCNKEPLGSKILLRVEQVAKGGQWDCTDIATPAGQSSELIGLYDISNPNNLPADFTQYENRYSATVMRDKNTPAMQASDYPLWNGDSIRSDVFTVLMENDKTSQQNLYAVDLFYIDSYKVD